MPLIFSTPLSIKPRNFWYPMKMPKMIRSGVYGIPRL